MDFRYDPILGLMYFFLEPMVCLDVEMIPDSLMVTPEEAIALFYSKGFQLIDSTIDRVDENFSLFHNGSLFYNGLKCEEVIIMDEIGQFDFGLRDAPNFKSDWYDFREIPSHEATDEIIEALNFTKDLAKKFGGIPQNHPSNYE